MEPREKLKALLLEYFESFDLCKELESKGIGHLSYQMSVINLQEQIMRHVVEEPSFAELVSESLKEWDKKKEEAKKSEGRDDFT